MFNRFMHDCGIKSYYLSNVSHAFNFVRLDGKHYKTDCQVGTVDCYEGYEQYNKNGKLLWELNRALVGTTKSAGQSTQMIIGATPENDYQIMRVSEALYEKFHLKRVFYSAFINVNGDSSLPVLPGGPPLLREHRLYQADWLLRYYRFHVDELLSEDRPNFNIYLDPKCDWALRHLDTFPVEINRASYQTLLRVPGIGYKSAQRIVAARRDTALTYDDLKKIGVVLKRALYFITCSGRMMYRTKLDEDYICSHLMADHTQVPTELRNSGYQQLSLFDTGLAL